MARNGNIRQYGRPEVEFATIRNSFIRDSEIKPAAFRVALWVMSHSETFQITQASIARALNFNESTVREGLKQLEGLGYLIRARTWDDKGHRTADDLYLSQLKITPEQREEILALASNAQTGKSQGGKSQPGKSEVPKEDHSNQEDQEPKEDLSEGDAEAPPDLLEASLPLNGKEAWTEEQRRAEYEQTPPQEEFSAKHVVAAYIDSFRVTSKGKDPVGRFIAQVGREAKRLIDQGIEPSAILAAAHALGKTQFATLENQYMRSLAGVPTGAQNGRSRTSVVPPPDVLAERKAWFEEHAEPAAPAAVYDGPQF